MRAEWACAEKGGGQSTCEALTALAAARGVQLLVVGSFGRKGEKGLDMLVRLKTLCVLLQWVRRLDY